MRKILAIIFVFSVITGAAHVAADWTNDFIKQGRALSAVLRKDSSSCTDVSSSGVQSFPTVLCSDSTAVPTDSGLAACNFVNLISSADDGVQRWNTSTGLIEPSTGSRSINNSDKSESGRGRCVSESSKSIFSLVCDNNTTFTPYRLSWCSNTSTSAIGAEETAAAARRSITFFATSLAAAPAAPESGRPNVTADLNATALCLVPNTVTNRCSCPELAAHKLETQALKPSMQIVMTAPADAGTTLLNGSSSSKTTTLHLAKVTFCVAKIGEVKLSDITREGGDEPLLFYSAKLVAHDRVPTTTTTASAAAAFSGVSDNGIVVLRQPVVRWWLSTSVSSGLRQVVEFDPSSDLVVFANSTTPVIARPFQGASAVAAAVLLLAPVVSVTTLPLFAAAASLASECSTIFSSHGVMGLRSLSPASINRERRGLDYAGTLIFALIAMMASPILLHVFVLFLWALSLGIQQFNNRSRMMPYGSSGNTSAPQQQQQSQNPLPVLSQQQGSSLVPRSAAASITVSPAQSDATTSHTTVLPLARSTDEDENEADSFSWKCNLPWRHASVLLLFPELSMRLLLAQLPIITHLSTRVLSSSVQSTSGKVASISSMLLCVVLWIAFFRCSIVAASQQCYFHKTVRGLSERPTTDWPTGVIPSVLYVHYEDDDFAGEKNSCMVGCVSLLPHGAWLTSDDDILMAARLPDPRIEPSTTSTTSTQHNNHHHHNAHPFQHHRSKHHHHSHHSHSSHHHRHATAKTSAERQGTSAISNNNITNQTLTSIDWTRVFSCVVCLFRVKYCFIGPILLLSALLIISILTALPSEMIQNCAAPHITSITICVCLGIASVVTSPLCQAPAIGVFPVSTLLCVFVIRPAVSAAGRDSTVGLFVALAAITGLHMLLSVTTSVTETWQWLPATLRRMHFSLTKLHNDVEMTDSAALSAAPSEQIQVERVVSPWTTVPTEGVFTRIHDLVDGAENSSGVVSATSVSRAMSYKGNSSASTIDESIGISSAWSSGVLGASDGTLTASGSAAAVSARHQHQLSNALFVGVVGGLSLGRGRPSSLIAPESTTKVVSPVAPPPSAVAVRDAASETDDEETHGSNELKNAATADINNVNEAAVQAAAAATPVVVLADEDEGGEVVRRIEVHSVLSPREGRN